MTAFDTDRAEFGHTAKRDKPRIVVKVGSSLLANTPDLRPDMPSCMVYSVTLPGYGIRATR